MIRVGASCLLLTIGLVTADAGAQSAPVLPPPQPSPFPPLHVAIPSPPTGATHGLEPTTDLRARFGVESATRLLHSGDADDRLRGVERAAAIHSSEGMSLLIHALDTGGAARFDARALVAVARGLAPFTSQGDARSALTTIVSSPPGPPRAPAHQSQDATDDVREQARVELARGISALALAESQDGRAVELLAGIARGGGAGQAFATNALTAFPPSLGMLGAVGTMNAQAMGLAAQLGDLRALEAINAAVQKDEPVARLAALRAMAQMGDVRALGIASSLVKATDPGTRAAAVEALMLLHAPDRLRALDALLADDKTARAGARLAVIEQDDGVIRALAARIAASADPAIRRNVVVALGRSSVPTALDVLAQLVQDPTLTGDATCAFAHSPNPLAMERIVGMLRAEPTRRLGARAYFARAWARGEREPRAETILAELARAKDGRDRAVGLAALVALGERALGPALADSDPRVRRAVAMAALSIRGGPEVDETLLQHLAVEPDPTTQETLAIGLADGDPNARITTLALMDRAESGRPDAPLAAMALARRAGATKRTTVDALLASQDPVMRAHTALGLGASREPDAVGRLAAAYDYEPNGEVRHALVIAIAGRTEDTDSPERARTLDVAARLDPDASVRALANRSRSGLPVMEAPAALHAVAWLRLETANGGAPTGTVTGALVRSDGLAVPIAFDDDGYAVIGVPPGESRLVLAPRVPAYDAARP